MDNFLIANYHLTDLEKQLFIDQFGSTDFLYVEVTDDIKCDKSDDSNRCKDKAFKLINEYLSKFNNSAYYIFVSFKGELPIMYHFINLVETLPEGEYMKYVQPTTINGECVWIELNL